MKKIVISQPMFFPWIGMLEQIKSADIFVYYDDVQFSKGSFTNRVQIKTNQGSKWLTVPITFNLGDNINQVKISDSGEWRKKHLSLLAQTYKEATFADEMMEIVRKVYEKSFENISELAIESMEALREYFSIGQETLFVKSSNLDINGNSSQRVVDIVEHFAGDTYITGHGARKYLDHELFEKNGIKVEYMNYKRSVYSQLHGLFDPHVTALDLIANVGNGGVEYINSDTKYWREFIKLD